MKGKEKMCHDIRSKIQQATNRHGEISKNVGELREHVGSFVTVWNTVRKYLLQNILIMTWFFTSKIEDNVTTIETKLQLLQEDELDVRKFDIQMLKYY